MFVILLNDLSKAFDCLNHDLLIVKLNAYGFSLTALRLIHDYLLSRKQRTNIFLADLFFTLNSIDIAKFVDDDTPYASAIDIDSLIVPLEKATKSLFTWFDNNLIKSNANKCHLLVSSNKKVKIKIGSPEIDNTKEAFRCASC